MKIIVIGSEGFIGGNLISFFTKREHELLAVDIVDRKATGYFKLADTPNCYKDLFTYFNADICINAAGSANVQLSFTQPQEDYRLNVTNVFSILDAIRRYNPECKFINLSSAAVYGNPVKLPINELDVLQPLSPYGLHKFYSEQICTEFFTHFGIATKSLRIFSAYGDGQRKMLFWDVYNKILSSKTGEIKLFGTGNESRDFIYIGDLVRAIDHIIQHNHFDGKAINIASGEEYSIKDAVKIFIAKQGSGYELAFTGEEKKGDPQNWRADVSRLKSLGFTTSFNLEQGLQNYLDWLVEKK